MVKRNINLSVVLHDNSNYKDWLVELKERLKETIKNYKK